MRAPIFIVSVNGDVRVHGSVAEAEASVESVDVEDGEYRAAYDNDGRLLELHVETPTKRSRFLGITGIELTPVRLRSVDRVPAHEGDLRAALITSLARQGVLISEATPLEALVKLSVPSGRDGPVSASDGPLRRLLRRWGLLRIR